MDAGGSDAGAAACPPEAFCEGFEGTNPRANGWRAFPDFRQVRFLSATNPDPRVTPFRGTGMVSVQTTTPGGAAEIEICPFEGFFCPPDDELFDAGPPDDAGVAMLPGITEGGLYMRAHVYIPSTLADGRELRMDHVNIVHVGSHRGAYVREPVVGFNNDVDRVTMFVEPGGVGRIEPRPPMGAPDERSVFPRDEWVCVRTHLVIDPVDGAVATFVGDSPTPVVERTGIDTLGPLPYRHFGVGLGYTEGMLDGAVVYLDEVAIGRQPVPCAR